MSVSAASRIGNSTIQIRKRSGSVVDYNKQKIRQAVLFCFVNSCGLPNDEATKIQANKVTERVEAIIKKEQGPVSVEHIQDLVEQVLMAMEQHEAARQYILYRDAHRKLREDSLLDPSIATKFAEGLTYFTGVNKHLQAVQSFDKFARFRHDFTPQRREVWPETVDRTVGFFREEMEGRGMHVPTERWEWLRQGLLKQEAAPSMRSIQLAGPALARCNSGVNNCSYVVMDSPETLAEDLYLLCQGCGVGFSVENEIAVENWPRVKRQVGGTPIKHVIDDTTEAWADSLKFGLNIWLDGGDVEFDYSKIRPEGALLRTKGGTASGPQPLKDLHRFARARILSRQRQCLESLDIHDITCYTHRIVQMGGVRRASGLSLSDLNDTLMRDCKAGAFYNSDPQRNQANDSTAYDGKPGMDQFMSEWAALVRGKSGERGIFNRAGAIAQMPERRRKRLTKHELKRIGCNPCGEIIELDRTFCNLSIGIIRPTDSVETIMQKISMAAAWGTMQSAMTRYNYLRPDWKKNVEKERLLGVDLLGHLDHYLIGGRSSLNMDEKGNLLRKLRDHAVAANVEWANILGINPSAAVTCNKPSGDSSVFFDTSAGFKAHHGQWFIRRLRFKADSPVAMVLKAAGVPNRLDYDKSGLLVFEFPCRAPVDNPILIGDKSAMEQLEDWKVYKINWTEHNPSATIYVRDEEWLAVGNWVYQNWDIVGGLSFLPQDDHIYEQAPYESITEVEYQQRADAFPVIDWTKIMRYEKKDMTELVHTYACTGGACEVR